MPNTFYPTQIGFVPSGSAPNSSKIVIGRNITGSWEAVGFGADGRPDTLNNFVINFTYTNAGQARKLGDVTLNAGDLYTIMNPLPNKQSYAPSNIELTFKEVSICELGDDGESVERKMIVLASQTYATGLKP